MSERHCEACGAVLTGRPEYKYCSRACGNAGRQNRATLICVCGVQFERRFNSIRHPRQYCSGKCAAEHQLYREVVAGRTVTGQSPELLARNVRIVTLFLEGRTRPKIAEMCGVTLNVVVSLCVRVGLKVKDVGVPRDTASRVDIQWTPAEDAIIREYQGETTAALAARIPGRTLKAVQARRNKLGRIGVIAKRTNENKNKGKLSKRRPMSALLIGAFEPTQPKPPSITCETVVPTSYDLPDPRHQCTYLYGRALPYRQCQAVAERGAWCAGHYAAVYRPDTAYERAA